VTFPANLRHIGKYAFSGCSSLQHIDLSSLNPDAEFGKEAFALLPTEEDRLSPLYTDWGKCEVY
jgi:hypothetical protein